MKTPDTIISPPRRPRHWLRPVAPPEAGDPVAGPLWQRLLWFAGLCLAGSVSVAGVAYVLRALPFGA